MLLSHVLRGNLRVWVKKHMFSDRSHSNFADFLVALSLIELQITRIPSVNDDALRVLIHCTPIVDRL